MRVLLNPERKTLESIDSTLGLHYQSRAIGGTNGVDIAFDCKQAQIIIKSTGVISLVALRGPDLARLPQLRHGSLVISVRSTHGENTRVRRVISLRELHS